MNRPTYPERLVRAAAGAYLIPRAIKGLFILAVVSFAALMVFLAIILDLLRHHGA